MGKKKNKNDKKTDSLSVEALSQRANSALISKQYKDAIDLFKQLLKLDPGDQWRHCLADAYLGRARDLAGKGMYKEALVLLENRQQRGGDGNTFRLQIIWTLLSGQHRQAIETFYKETDRLQRYEIDHVEATLALLIISGNDEILQFIPEGSKLKTDSMSAQLAVRAYCQGNDVELSCFLKKISFRSPFRDIRSILSALSLNPDELKSGRERLEKIPHGSPFNAAAKTARLAISNEVKIAPFEKMTETARTFITAVHGIDKHVYRLVVKISHSAKSAKTFFNALLHPSALDENPVLQTYCYKLLPYYPGGINAYQKRFGVLPQFDLSRIAALSYERIGDEKYAGWAWEDASDALAKQPSSKNNRLTRALILRRSAECCDRYCGGYTEDAEQLLEQSLEYDPDDLSTFLSLFDRYKALDGDAIYRNCVERALKQFPEESQVLMAAIELAIERNTFKKAAKFAKLLLQKDSINKRARSLLINAHLSQAGKQIVVGRFDLAVKEIDEAEKMERPGNPSGAIPLHRGILEYARKNEVQGEAMIEQAYRIIGNYPKTYFQVLIEMSRLKIAQRYRKKYDSLLRNTASHKPNKSTFLGFIKDFQRYSLEDDVDIHGPLTSLKKYLVAAVALDFNRQEMELVCETFQNLDALQHLKNFAAAATQQWAEFPIFVYFLVFAKTDGNPMRLLPKDIAQLKWAIETAQTQKNFSVANRLIEYLENGLEFSFFGQSGQIEDKINEDTDEPCDSFPPLEFPGEILLDYGDEKDDEITMPKPRAGRKKTVRDPFTIDIFDD